MATATALVGFGVHDEIVYHRMPAQEWARYRPVREEMWTGNMRREDAADGATIGATKIAAIRNQTPVDRFLVFDR
jgi:hypothetical protein